jgi:hypothetical protein
MLAFGTLESRSDGPRHRKSLEFMFIDLSMRVLKGSQKTHLLKCTRNYWQSLSRVEGNPQLC